MYRFSRDVGGSDFYFAARLPYQFLRFGIIGVGFVERSVAGIVHKKSDVVARRYIRDMIAKENAACLGGLNGVVQQTDEYLPQKRTVGGKGIFFDVGKFAKFYAYVRFAAFLEFGGGVVAQFVHQVVNVKRFVMMRGGWYVVGGVHGVIGLRRVKEFMGLGTIWGF